jgi:hypothetical protein
MQETQILFDFHKMLLKDVERLETEEPAVNVKWLAFFFKKMPLQFPAILDAYFNAMVQNCLSPFL